MSLAITDLPRTATPSLRPGWLLNPSFDLTLVVGVAGLALLSGLVVAVAPQWFGVLLFLDLWLLGYHHVIATFTRLTFDRESIRNNRFLIFWLPPMVLAVTVALCFTAGIWAVATTFLLWQWFHYTRQSYGIARAYLRKADGLADASALSLVLYALPVLGILTWCARGFDRFLGMPVWLPPVPWPVVGLTAAVTLFSILWWGYTQFLAWRAGRLSVSLNLYVASHLVIYSVAYFAFLTMEFGWLVINVWHNAQYILFVWLANARRFEKAGERPPSLLAVLSQKRAVNVVAYFAVTFVITIVLYGAIAAALNSPLMVAIPAATLIVYQTINFHHYIVDAVIWRAPRPKPAAAN